MIVILKNILIKIIYILIIIYLMIFIPCIWGYKPLVIVSGSMEPILKVGGILYYKKQDINNFNKDDILVYTAGDHIISHRIVDKINDGFITKGDNNKSIDTVTVDDSRVIGRGTNWSIPYLGYYADFIYTHKYLLIIFVILIIIDLIIDNRRRNE